MPPSSLLGALLDERPDCRVRKCGREKMMQYRSGGASLAGQTGGMYLEYFDVSGKP
jgi:hypothetical protein